MSCPSTSGGGCHAKLVAYAAGILVSGVAAGYLISQYFSFRKARHNYHVKLDNEKVVDVVDVEDIGKKQVFCRCWKSKKFPYCDGAHNIHNSKTGDNVGPLIVQQAQRETK